MGGNRSKVQEGKGEKEENEIVGHHTIFWDDEYRGRGARSKGIWLRDPAKRPKRLLKQLMKLVPPRAKVQMYPAPEVYALVTWRWR